MEQRADQVVATVSLAPPVVVAACEGTQAQSA